MTKPGQHPAGSSGSNGFLALYASSREIRSGTLEIVIAGLDTAGGRSLIFSGHISAANPLKSQPVPRVGGHIAFDAGPTPAEIIAAGRPPESALVVVDYTADSTALIQFTANQALYARRRPITRLDLRQYAVTYDPKAGTVTLSLAVANR